MLLVTALLLVGCSSPEEEMIRSDYNEYFPLVIGNWWEYGEMESDKHITFTVDTTDVFENKEYYHISGTDNSQRWFRFSGSKLYQWHNEQDLMLVNFEWDCETVYLDPYNPEAELRVSWGGTETEWKNVIRFTVRDTIIKYSDTKNIIFYKHINFTKNMGIQSYTEGLDIRAGNTYEDKVIYLWGLSDHPNFNN